MNQIKPSITSESLSASDLFPGFSTQEAVEKYFAGFPELHTAFRKLPLSVQNVFSDYATGKHGLPATYDSVFQRIFKPDIHRERLSELISSILGQKVHIIDILPREGSQLVEKGSFIIMDALVRLNDGTYANIEMQKIGYQFPLSRADCYTSDAIMRQYVRLKNELGQKFNFMQMQKVYCIVLMETSPVPFHEFPDIYLHHRKSTFDSGIYKNDSGLHEDIFICLDTFRSIIHTIDKGSSMQDAWFTFLSATDLGTIHTLITSFPEFKTIYKEIADYFRDPKELMNMFSDELRIMDRNTERLMVNDLQNALIEKENLLSEQEQRIAFLEAQIAQLTKQ